MLVSDRPHVFQIDVGANGYYGYEVMDTCRPSPDADAGDTDLSLLSYLQCCENAYLEYQKRVEGASFADTFTYLAYHTPFGGMVKGAHRNMMRKLVKAKPAEIEADFQRRVTPSLEHCQRVGNIMGATAAMALASTIDNGDFKTAQRVGVFSYGSGCCSEFFSGTVREESQERLRTMKIGARLDKRYELSMDQYDTLLARSKTMKFGTRNLVADAGFIPEARGALGEKTLFLKQINEFRREYEWVS
jgi:polyketide biosynthesis 3-hydroxy-3-methylglutaryl-CoA synthase-like enzyme PksG